MCELRPLLAGELVGDELTTLLGNEEAREFPTGAIGISTGDEKFARLNFELSRTQPNFGLSALFHVFDIPIDVSKKMLVLFAYHLSHLAAVQGFRFCGVVVLNVVHDVLLSK